jgi:hypothetical protein
MAVDGHGLCGMGEYENAGLFAGGMMLEYRYGWLFVGLDGALYKVEFEPRRECWFTVREQPKANGWTVDQVRAEFWHGVFPPYEIG